MSNTRHSKIGSPLTQQGFCSSPEYEHGLLGNIVAMRCALLDSAEERKLLFALQYLSWQPGGLKKVASNLVREFPTGLGTESMRRFGCKPGQLYDASQVKAVRAEIPLGEERFPLRGEATSVEWACVPEGRNPLDVEEGCWRKSYPAAAFQKLCQEEAETLPGLLARLCDDPKLNLANAGPWYFPELVRTLREYMEIKASQAAAGVAETSIAKLVYDALEYCLESHEMTQVYGLARIGKTYPAKTWCAQNPGLARYVQVPPTNDDASFVRRIADAYGVSSGLSFKNTQIRERVERAAHDSGLMLVLDEAHMLLTQDYRARKRPSRITWILNEFVNYGVPVLLLTTPQFEEDKRRIKERTGWNWDQFDGRIGVPIVLPQELPQADLVAVARAHLPNGDARSIKALVGYATFSKSQLAGIEHVVKRARFEAQKAGRDNITLADIQSAIQRRMPIDSVASVAIPPGHPGRPRRSSFAVSRPVVSAPAVCGRHGPESGDASALPRQIALPQERLAPQESNRLKDGELAPVRAGEAVFDGGLTHE